MNKQELLSKLDLIAKRIGNTPIVSLEHPSVNLFAKIESTNLMGSIKDRAAYNIIRGAVERDEINIETSVIEASSGNFAVSCSVICAILGLRFVAVIDPGINKVYEKLISHFAHDIIRVTKRDRNKGFLLTKLDAVHQFCELNENTFWTNQYSNPDNFSAHYNGTAVEICHHFDSLDYVFISVATGGTLAGISCRLKETYPRIKVVAVDIEGSVIFGGAPKPRYIPGMGSGIVPPLVNRAKIDEVVTITENETALACRELVLDHALFLGGSTGTCYHAVNKYFAGKQFAERPNVIFLNPDRGHAYVNNVYDDAWLVHHLPADVDPTPLPTIPKEQDFALPE